jgi:flagellar hook-basal body complex protein FliE
MGAMVNIPSNKTQVDPLSALEPRGRTAATGAPTATDELAGTFTRMFDEVNRLQGEADRKIEEFATSPDKDIHGTMIALQKADLSLRLMMQIRAKLTAAYQDVMRMQL